MIRAFNLDCLNSPMVHGSFKVDNEGVWNDVKEGKVRGYSIEGFFNEVGVAMSGVKNYEAELVLELDQILAGLDK